jgi:NADPH:quinone reductase
MPSVVPQQMRAIILEAYHDNATEAIASLKVGARPVPELRHGQVLVKIEAAPCNPSDVLFLQGRYGVLKPLPAVPGWEGAGTVVASGGGWLAGWLQGKRVACGSQSNADGTWAEYVAANAGECIPLKRQVSAEQGASLIINPLTAVGLLDVARRQGHRGAIQTAAASQLGRMLVVLAADAGYPLVSVVRREAQVALLKSLGAVDVLNSSQPDFLEQLKSICDARGVTAGFDAIAGEMTGTLLNAMPPGSTVFVYGGLAGEPCGEIDPVELIFNRKTVTGFYLGAWLKQRGSLGILRAAGRIQRLLAEGRIAMQVQRRLGFHEVAEGLQQYLDHMTDGKVLIVPGRSG